MIDREYFAEIINNIIERLEFCNVIEYKLDGENYLLTYKCYSRIMSDLDYILEQLNNDPDD